MGLGTWLTGGSSEEKDRKRSKWDALVQANPDLAPTAEDYNAGLKEFMKSGNLPTDRTVPEHLEDVPGKSVMLPSSPPGQGPGEPSVPFQATRVAPEQVRPIHIGEPPPDYAVLKDGKYVKVPVDPSLQGKPFKILPGVEQQEQKFATPEQFRALVSPEIADPVIASYHGNPIPLSIVEHAYSWEVAKTAKDAAKTGKDVTLAEKEEQHQDALEKQQRDRYDKEFSNRSGGIGLQDTKVNAAIHARQLIEGSRNPQTGEIEANQLTSPELAMTLANIVSGSSNANLETFNAMQPQALSADIQKKIGYLFGKPVKVLPKEWADQLVHMLDRQGVTSEKLRDKYFDDIDKTAPSKLAKERRDYLKELHRGNSYRDTFGIKEGDSGYQNQKTINGKTYVKVNGEWYEK